MSGLTDVIDRLSLENAEKDEQIKGLENTAIRDEKSFADIRWERDIFKYIADNFEQERSNYVDIFRAQSTELTRLRQVEKATRAFVESAPESFGDLHDLEALVMATDELAAVFAALDTQGAAELPTTDGSNSFVQSEHEKTSKVS